jgi:hypothetical protein
MPDHDRPPIPTGHEVTCQPGWGADIDVEKGGSGSGLLITTLWIGLIFETLLAEVWTDPPPHAVFTVTK